MHIGAGRQRFFAALRMTGRFSLAACAAAEQPLRLTMHFKIAVLKGDGIGPEIVDESLRVLQAVGGRFGHEFDFVEAYAGGEAWERYGEHLPTATLDVCRKSDAILKGPFGGPT